MSQKDSDSDITIAKIRPAGRHILTIGRDLIKDSAAAIVELVKNAYDADATEVNIDFSETDTEFTITVSDNGHGMAKETILKRWMVPSTDDKLHRRLSPKKRLMQGRKGIGRYAASMLGDQMVLTTTDEKSITTSIFVNWSDFEKIEYLDDINIELNSKKTQLDSGTRIEIISGKEKAKEWIESAQRTLVKELRKLLSPISKEVENFKVKLTFDLKLPGQQTFWKETFEIDPFPLLDYYNYRLYGQVNADGKCELIYENPDDPKGAEEIIEIKLSLLQGEICGPIEIDLRVFDKESDSISTLIEKGMIDPVTRESLGLRETRNLLKDLAGASIYRGGFRIRPYGEAGYDWLELDKARVQNPSMRIGSDQLIGFISVASEEISHLEEKSARDGLKENQYYYGLREIVRRCLGQIENRRFEFRKRTGKGRKRTLSSRIDDLFDYVRIQKLVQEEIQKLISQIHHKSKDEIRSELNKLEKRLTSSIANEAKEKGQLAEEIKRNISLYESKVTLANVIGFILHEVRKPLSVFKNQTKFIPETIESLKSKPNKSLLDDLQIKLARLREQSDFFIQLFSKLDPLAARRRTAQKDILMKGQLASIGEIFHKELEEKKIELKIIAPEKFSLRGWPEDFVMIFANLIENSIYWFKEKKEGGNNIEIECFYDENVPVIDYRDNGPGIDRKNIVNDLIFEPGFTTKESGTGLGLSIAGEAAVRSNLQLQAVYDPAGALFRLIPKTKED